MRKTPKRFDFPHTFKFLFSLPGLNIFLLGLNIHLVLTLAHNLCFSPYTWKPCILVPKQANMYVLVPAIGYQVNLLAIVSLNLPHN